MSAAAEASPAISVARSLNAELTPAAGDGVKAPCGGGAEAAAGGDDGELVLAAVEERDTMAKELKRRKEEIAGLQRKHQEMEQTHMSSAAQLGDALANCGRVLTDAQVAPPQASAQSLDAARPAVKPAVELVARAVANPAQVAMV